MIASLKNTFSTNPARWTALAVALFALLVHLAFLAVLPVEMQGESPDYEGFYRPLADRLLDGEGLVDEEGRVAMRYPPGFSLLLTGPVALSRVLPGSDVLWIRAFLALCVAATAFLFVEWARRISGSLFVALMAGVGWSLYPPQLWMTKQANSELPFLVLMVGALVLWWRTLDKSTGVSTRKNVASALAAGALLGAATLVRPIGLLMAPVLGLAALGGAWLASSRPTDSMKLPLRRTAVLGLLLIAGQIVAVAPWILFVHGKTGAWIPVSSGGRLSLLDGLTLGVDPQEASPELSERVLELTHDVQAHRAEIRGPLSAARFLGERALEDPWPVAELLAVKATRAWYGTESVRHEKALLMIQVPALLLALLGGWSLLRSRPVAAMTILSLVLYFWAMAFLVLSILRYLMPAMLLLMVPIAWLVAAALRYLGVLMRLAWLK